MAKKLLIGFVALVGVVGMFFIFSRAATTYERPAEINTITGRPPTPNFFEPVDYVAWMHEQYGANKPPGSSDAYRRFWPDPRSSEESMPKPAKDVRAGLLTLTTGPEWHAEQHPSVDDYLSSVTSMLDMFKAEVEQAPGYQFVPKPDEQDPRNPMLILLPKIDGSRHAIPCLLALAWRGGANRQAQLLDAWRLGFAHARHLQESKQLIMGRIGMAIRLVVYESMRGAVSADALDQQGIRDAVQLLAELDPGPLNLGESIRIEWGGTLGFVQALYPRGRLNRELAEMIGYVGGKSPRFVKSDEVRASGISPAELAKAADEHYLELLRIAQDPVSFRTLQELKTLDTANAGGPLRGHPLRPSIQPVLRLVFREAFRTTATERGTRLGFAVLAHFHTKGQLPSSLAEVCHDARQRTDPGSGEDFVYSVSDPSNKNGFMLNSVAEDGTDDGGRHAPWGDIYKQTLPADRDFVFWPFQGTR